MFISELITSPPIFTLLILSFYELISDSTLVLISLLYFSTIVSSVLKVVETGAGADSSFPMF